MANAKSTLPARPGKPYSDFPLGAHPNGKWCKRIRGKLYYFGTWGDWQAALAEYQQKRDYLYAGKVPPPVADQVTIRDVCNEFLTLKDQLVESGELKPRTFSEYKSACRRTIDVLGEQRQAGDIQPDDFERLRREMAKKLGPIALGNEINRIRSVFRFAYEHRLISKPVIYGQAFKRPAPKTIRLQRKKNGLRLFEPAQIHALLEVASMQMRAMLLLGANAGFGNSDCGQLETSCLDLDAGWFDYARPKTGIDRRGKLWPETVRAIRDVLACRLKPKLTEHADLVFVTTKRRLSWYKDTPDNPISKEFRKLADQTGVYRRGLTYYALRHTFETIAGECGDQVAVNHVMGHVDNSMAAVCRERISDERLERVSNHVRTWLFGEGVAS